MTIELTLTLAMLGAVLVLAAQAWYAMPQYPDLLETVEVGQVAVESPRSRPLPQHDVLDDFAAELGFEALTAEGSAEHRLALLDALLEEADHETVRLEFLVNKLGNQLVPAA